MLTVELLDILMTSVGRNEARSRRQGKIRIKNAGEND